MTYIPDKYLVIQVRNTDIKCDFMKLYDNHISLINSYNYIYLCTDDKKIKNLYCFNEFPSNSYENLHNSNLNPDNKIKNLMVDIFMAINSDRIISNSPGGFIKFLRVCHKNKEFLLNKIKNLQH